MKKYMMLGFSVLTVASFVACGTDQREQAARMAKEGGGEKTQETLQAESCVHGGYAGTISLGGVLIIPGDSSTSYDIDPKIKTELTAGMGADGQVDPAQKSAKVHRMSAPLQTTLDQLEKVAAAKTYLNLGCENLETDFPEIAGFTAGELNSEKIEGQEFNRIFVCGKQEISAKILSLVTSEVVLRNSAELTIHTAGSGSIAIYTDKLTLEGENTIQLKAVDSTDKISDDVTGINLNVLKEVNAGTDGKGTLRLQSIGASCEKQASVEEPPSTEK